MRTCNWCGKLMPTHLTGEECDNCWEVRSRIQCMPAELIEKMLRALGFQARVMGRAN